MEIILSRSGASEYSPRGRGVSPGVGVPRALFGALGLGKQCEYAFCPCQHLYRALSGVQPSLQEESVHWRVPNPPGANPLVAERAPWRSSQSCVTGGQQPIGNPYRFLSFLLHTWQPLCDPNSHSWRRLFQLSQGVSTRGVRHAPELRDFARPLGDPSLYESHAWRPLNASSRRVPHKPSFRQAHWYYAEALHFLPLPPSPTIACSHILGFRHLARCAKSSELQ